MGFFRTIFFVYDGVRYFGEFIDYQHVLWNWLLITDKQRPGNTDEVSCYTQRRFGSQI